MNLPFTNIRQVLSLHNKVSPEKIFLTVISDKGREELSYAEFSARCHQTANFLQEDLGIKPGDVVAIWDARPDTAAVLLMACWLVGAVAAPFSPPYGNGVTEEEDKSGRVKAYFIRHHDEPFDRKFSEIVKYPLYVGKPLIQLGGVPTEGYPHFDTLVRGMPNSFFNDHPEPDLTSPAFIAPYHVRYKQPYSNVTVTQGELLNTAQNMAFNQFITGNQRLISYLKFSNTPTHPGFAVDIMSFFTSALLVGGSIVLDSLSISSNKPDFWRMVASERLHIGFLHEMQLSELIIFALKQRSEGKPIYGEGIYQQDITQLRHVYCPGAKGHDDLIKQFTNMFPFPVVTNSYA